MTHLHADFLYILKRCDAIVTHYCMKVKCFSFRTLPKLASYSDSICCLLWFCSRRVKAVVIKNGDGARDIL